MDLGGNWPWALVGSSFRKGSRKIGIASPHCISLAYINRPPPPPLGKHTPPRYHAKWPEYMSITLSYMEPAEFHIFLIFNKIKLWQVRWCIASQKKQQKKKSGHLDMGLLQIQISDLSESVRAERRGKRGKEVFLLLFLSDSRIRHLKRFAKKNQKKGSTP